jgi:hypothetical protein
MFEKLRIKEHMEVVDHEGRHIGTVDDIEDDFIRLTRSDSEGGRHRFLPLDAVDRIADNRVYLEEGARIPAET